MYDQDHCIWRSYKETKNSKPYFSPIDGSKSVLLATSTGAWK